MSISRRVPPGNAVFKAPSAQVITMEIEEKRHQAKARLTLMSHLLILLRIKACTTLAKFGFGMATTLALVGATRCRSVVGERWEVGSAREGASRDRRKISPQSMWQEQCRHLLLLLLQRLTGHVLEIGVQLPFTNIRFAYEFAFSSSTSPVNVSDALRGRLLLVSTSVTYLSRSTSGDKTASKKLTCVLRHFEARWRCMVVGNTEERSSF